MCKCLKEIEEKTFEAVKAQKEGEFTKGNITPSSFLIVKNKFSDRATHSEYEFTFALKKKDGTIGKPKNRPLISSTPIAHSVGKNIQNKSFNQSN